MVINFNGGGGGGVTPEQVQQMINDALDFTTGVINLSKASAEEVISAFTDPDRWLCAIDWSGDTYLEQERRINPDGKIVLSFYVIGASADTFWKKIYDKLISAQVTPSTGEVSISADEHRFVPNIIYDLDSMNTDQLKRLATRVRQTASALFQRTKEFSATWAYNGKRYVYSTGCEYSGHFYLLGTAMGPVDNTPVIFYDRVDLPTSTGSLTHMEFTSNIVLTPVQE